jgi:hypothetical protein
VNGYKSDSARNDELVTVTGTVQFFWDSGDDERHLLVNIEPDDVHKPDAYELVDDIRDAVISSIEEGSQIEIDYIVEHHEVVDPDGATTLDGHRPRILEVRILG